MEAAKKAPKIARTKFVEIHQTELAGIDLEFEVVDGIPDREIVRRAKEIQSDLILMATHGWTGFKHFILGGVAEKTVRKAPCSVLTVRPAANTGGDASQA